MKNKFLWLEAVFTIFGTVVGLGVFALPYAAKKVGVTPGVLLIFLVACFIIILNILFAEIIIHTKKDICIVAYAKKYLGVWAEKIETFSILFGYTGSLLAYVLAIAVFVQSILPTQTSYFWPIVLIFTAVSGLVILKGVESLGKMELILSLIMIGIFLLVSFYSIPHWGSTKEDWGNLLVPYGVVWFALIGESAIPIAIRILDKKRKKILSVIFFAYLLAFLITVIFFIAALKTGGGNVGLDPFIAISKKIGTWVLYLGSFLGILAVVTSHWVLATYLKKILTSDIKIPGILSWFVVVFLPLILILIGASNFVHVVGLVGVVAGTTDSLIILTIYNKLFNVKKVKPVVLPWAIKPFFIWIIFFVLIGAALSSILV